jgi:hypothetical protein
MTYEEGLERLRNLKREFEDPVPETIYHYTSPEGFPGIVDSGELWLTNAAFVNDTMECRAFWDHAKSLLGDKRLANKHVKETLKSRMGDPGSCAANDNYYVASFSKEVNLLSQYRAYGSVCIAFDPRRMIRTPFTLYDCVYGEKELAKWIRQKSMLPGWKSLDNGDWRYAVVDLLFAAQVKCKDANYQAEREVRVVTVSHHSWDPLYAKTWPSVGSFVYGDDPPIYFRDHPVRKMLPYVKFFISAEQVKDASQALMKNETAPEMKRRKLRAEKDAERGLLPIAEVWIGPMGDQEQFKLACEIMLRDKGYENVRVIASKIPYRGT